MERPNDAWHPEVIPEKAWDTIRALIPVLSGFYPVLFPSHVFRGIQVADPRDIACMKLSAVARRGTKRDFVDLYAAAHRFGLAEISPMFDRKYAGSRHNPVHLQKSLTYFRDAEADPMPHMLTPASWEEIKRYFTTEVPRLL